MKCVYCESRMLFDATLDAFTCPECSAKLVITQHPELLTKSNLIKYNTDLGKERPEHMKSFNNDGIATQWYRGNK